MTNHIDTIALDTANYTGPGGASFGGTVNVVVPMTDPFVGIPAPVPSPNPVYTDPNLALGAGNIWQPGTYEGFYPQFMVGVKKTLVATSMAPGIYVIHNVSATMLVGTNAILGSPQHGGTDPTGAVAIVLDSSDTGTLDISQADINGMDDNGTGLRDPLGTHNFVVYGPTYTGAVSLGSGGSSTAYVTGIVDLPLAGAATLSGNPSFHFSGEDVFKSVDVKGAGNGTQTFSSVCNLRAVSGSTGGGLVR
jgi:hypothetical protein